MPSCPPIQLAGDAGVAIWDGVRTRGKRNGSQGAAARDTAAVRARPADLRGGGRGGSMALAGTGRLSWELGRSPTATWQPVPVHKGKCSRQMTVEGRGGGW